jgi:peptide/nickel transport system substrate-binding protein
MNRKIVVILVALCLVAGMSWAAGKYKEAPMLTALVKAGKLPPIEQRLPAEPMVVGPGTYMTKADLPDWKAGKYGGTLRGAHSVANWSPDFFVALDEPLLQAPKIGVQGVVGAVLKDYKVENNNKDFTFYMRKGLKWSDGEPVTTEDVRFTYEDILLNEKLTPIFPAKFRNGFRADGEPMKLEIVDDYTFKVHFTEPYGGFLRAITIEGWVGYTDLLNPSHYLKKWHTKYTPIENMAAELKKMNLTNEWWQLFTAQKWCQNWDMSNPRAAGYPCLNAWMVVASGSPTTLTWERNPYYFKVDTQGQQLPYIDKLVSQQVENVEMVNMKVLTGEVDYLRESTALVKIPLYKQSEKKAGFKVALLDMHVDSSSLRLNQTFDDPIMKPLFQNVKFRQAISLSINRKEIIDSVYYGYASLPLDTVGAEFSAYDPAKANKMLDELGLTKKDADGFRLGSDGKPLAILLEHAAAAPDFIPIADLVSQYIKKIGIKMTVKQLDPNLWSQKWDANQVQTSIHWSHDVGWDGDITLGNYARAGREWEAWRTSNGKSGSEPPAWAKKAIEIDQARWQAVSGSAEYNKLVQDGLKWTRDNLPLINFVEKVKYPMIVSAKLGNVPTGGYAIAADFSIIQMYFK